MIKNILLVDDDLLFRKTIKTILSDISSDFNIVTFNSIVSLDENNDILDYDLILLDYELPVISGEKAILYVKKNFPDKTIVTITSKEKNEILNHSKIIGDFFIRKPNMETRDENYNKLKKELSATISVVNKLNTTEEFKTNKIEINDTKKILIQNKNKIPKKYDLILVACSTGGPKTLEVIFNNITKHNIPIAIVQHMPENFTKFFATSLTNKLGIEVNEAISGSYLTNETFILAKGGSHLKFRTTNNQIMIYNDKISDFVNSVRPSADVTFESVCDIGYDDKKILVIVLTGIGADGTDGVRKLKEFNNNVTCITESQESCVIYGMPKSVDSAGLSDFSLSKEEINVLLKEVLD